MNITLSFLSLYSHSTSPFLACQDFLHVSRSNLVNFFEPFVYNWKYLNIDSTKFNNFLGSSLIYKNDDLNTIRSLPPNHYEFTGYNNSHSYMSNPEYVNITSCAFISCKSFKSKGGAICCVNAQNLDLSGSSFVNCYSYLSGGAIYYEGQFDYMSTISIESCCFSYCYAQIDQAFFIKGSSIYINSGLNCYRCGLEDGVHPGPTASFFVESYLDIYGLNMTENRLAKSYPHYGLLAIRGIESDTMFVWIEAYLQDSTIVGNICDFVTEFRDVTNVGVSRCNFVNNFISIAVFNAVNTYASIDHCCIGNDTETGGGDAGDYMPAQTPEQTIHIATPSDPPTPLPNVLFDIKQSFINDIVKEIKDIFNRNVHNNINNDSIYNYEDNNNNKYRNNKDYNDIKSNNNKDNLNKDNLNKDHNINNNSVNKLVNLKERSYKNKYSLSGKSIDFIKLSGSYINVEYSSIDYYNPDTDNIWDDGDSFHKELVLFKITLVYDPSDCLVEEPSHTTVERTRYVELFMFPTSLTNVIVVALISLVVFSFGVIYFYKIFCMIKPEVALDKVMDIQND